MPGIDTRWLVARRDGRTVGWLRLYLHTIENTENASVELTVDPAYRRHGIGRALHEHGLRLLREHGGRRLVGATVAALPGEEGRAFPGAAFAAAVGADPALADVRRRLDVAGLDRDRLAALLAGARAASTGYRPVRWRDHDTWNAAANRHMIAINEQLGFRPAAGSVDWQLTDRQL
ncbi:N-acetyltransferase family protein [Micromonospora tulbaghiae]